MKSRIGFVSNSSSTSFVLLGWKISEEQAKQYVKDVIGLKKDESDADEDDEDEWPEAIYEDDGKNGIYRHGEEDEYFLGYMIAEASSDSQFDGESVDLVNAIDKAKKFGEKIGLNDPKIFVGTYAS